MDYGENTFWPTIKRDLVSYDFWLLTGRISALASIFGFCFVIYPKLINSNEALWGVIFIGICLVFFFIDNFFYKKEIGILSRQAKYSNAISYLNSGFAPIHDLLRKAKNNFRDISWEEKDHAFENLCNNLVKAYTNITGNSCSVCIKVFEPDENIKSMNKNPHLIKVMTINRDSESKEKRNFEKAKELNHYVAWNTDFFQIFENIGSLDGERFFCNELPYLSEYYNTSFPLYDKNLTYKGFPSNMSKKDKLKYWPLPYKSTVVVPICPHSGKTATLDETIGFLCVDSFKMNAFDKNHDYNILIGVADGIYYPLYQWMLLGYQ